MNHPVFTGAQFAPDPFCVIFWLKWSQLRVLFVVCQLALAKAVGIADKMYNGCDLIWCDVRCLCIIRPLDRQASNKKWEGDSTQFDIQTCNYICSDICNYPISTKTYPYKSIYITILFVSMCFLDVIVYILAIDIWAVAPWCFQVVHSLSLQFVVSSNGNVKLEHHHRSRHEDRPSAK